jgi:hypothetical protein
MIDSSPLAYVRTKCRHDKRIILSTGVSVRLCEAGFVRSMVML